MKKLVLAVGVFAASCGVAFAQSKACPGCNESSADWWKPKAVTAEVVAGKAGSMFDSSSSSAAGVRVYGQWRINREGSSLGFRLGYIDMGSTAYSFGQTTPGSNGDSNNFGLFTDGAVRDGDRLKYGFPAFSHKVTWAPKGIEFGPEYRLMLGSDRKWHMNIHVSYIYDLSGLPEFQGFSIPDAKVKRGGASSFGFGFGYKFNNDFEAGVGYEHLSFSSHVTGGGTAWQPQGGTYLHGLRVYDSLTFSVGKTF